MSRSAARNSVLVALAISGCSGPDVPDPPFFVLDRPDQGLQLTLTSTGALISMDRRGSPTVALSLRAWGRTESLADFPPGAGPFASSTGRLSTLRPGLVEWWETTNSGLEHGFTVNASPRRWAAPFRDRGHRGPGRDR